MIILESIMKMMILQEGKPIQQQNKDYYAIHENQHVEHHPIIFFNICNMYLLFLSL